MYWRGKAEDMEKVRLNRFLSEMGICSRREADRLVEAGRVLVDGEPAVKGQKVSLEQRIVCDGKLVCDGDADLAGDRDYVGERGAPEAQKDAGAQRAARLREDTEGRGAARLQEDTGGRGAARIREDTGGRGAARLREDAGGQRAAGLQKDREAASREQVGRRPEPIWLVVNKPRGIVCTTSDKDRAMNIVEMVGYPQRVYPVGRLDKESEGLLLMTNEGQLMDALLRGSHAHEREYEVRVDKPITDSFLKGMAAGVELKELERTTRPCKICATGKTSFRIVLTQGLNRQIRRMCQVFGYRVTALKRVRIMNIHLGALRPGSYRRMTKEEYTEMCRLLQRMG